MVQEPAKQKSGKRSGRKYVRRKSGRLCILGRIRKERKDWEAKKATKTSKQGSSQACSDGKGRKKGSWPMLTSRKAKWRK